MQARAQLFGTVSILALAIGMAGCGSTDQPGREDTTTIESTLVMDKHSASTPEEAVVKHLDLELEVDMAARRINGTATYAITNHGKGHIVFDTDGGMEIRAVKDGMGNALTYKLGEQTFLGRALMVDIGKDVEKVSIAYTTGPDAAALQWLSPQQTGDKKHPFLFTQGQAILTRTWIPVQDSPGIRITYDARVRVPSELMAVMSATNSTERSADGAYSFSMKQPIPPYLIALAVGDLRFQSVGERTGVYAEPGMVEKAAKEFVDMERMVVAAEELYGPYRWGRYDVIVLPPSFPFGGMENPMLTFATPTIIAGDGSLVALIAHELAHSWSGNLVTNATWDDFWLNEGFTVYFEKRICEKLYGKDYAQMLAMLGRQELMRTLHQLEADSMRADTKLKLDLAGRNPDDGMTDVAYEKGYAFLTALEAATGREKFDPFLRGYFDRFAFQSMTTEGFLDYLKKELLSPLGIAFNVEEWVYSPGLPPTAPQPMSDRFALVDTELEKWKSGTAASSLSTQKWTPFQWMHFLRHLPTTVEHPRLKELDGSFGFTASGNTEIQAAWFEVCIRSDYREPYVALSDFLTRIGRRKFLMPLYAELMKTEGGAVVARGIYKQARPNYHAVSVRTIDEMLDWQRMSEPVTM